MAAAPQLEGDSIDTDILSADAISAASNSYNLTPDQAASVFAICTRCDLLRTQGDELLDACHYVEATRRYREAFNVMMGNDFEVPLWSKTSGMISQRYVQITDWQRITLMHCCNGVAQCRAKLNDLQGALDWIEEVEIIYKHTYFTTDIMLPWKSYDLESEEFFVERVTAYVLASEVFLELGNTGAAAHRRHGALSVMGSLPDHHSINKSLEDIIKYPRLFEIMKLRHPDPSLVQRLTVEDASLTVRGAWKKVAWPQSGNLRAGSRLGFSSFIAEGCLYIAGGLRNHNIGQNQCYRDLFCLDLQKLDAWRELPAYPIPESISGQFIGWTMVVHKSRALLFTGRPQVDFFDLVTENWGSFMTRMKPGESWPYDGPSLLHYTAQLVDGQLYVFGGSHFGSWLGCNVLMKLDLETLQWQHLSGTSKPQADYSCPGPRIYPMSWVVNDRLFMMYGMANRQAALLHHQPDGAEIDYPYDDMWSWSMPERKWRQERWVGNPPSPRCESAYVYNAKLKKTIVFGGYSPCVGTDMGTKGMSPYSYYADTFIFNHSTSTWKHVLTRGFPTYRAQSHLLSDPFTGKTFLFGGYTNSDYVASRKKFISRSFDDLWQLCTDEPGGFFEGVNFEKETKTAPAGPWQRCFACSSVGQWKKCGGTCKGSVFFCDAQCLKDGWKEHKKTHNCRKG